MAQTAGGKRKGLVWDLVKDVESVIKKDGTKTSEKKWVCRFCEKPFQGGPNVIQAHHGVHGTGKKKAIQLCKHTPADVKARLQQEMSITLRSIAPASLHTSTHLPTWASHARLLRTARPLAATAPGLVGSH